nr:MAG TPA: hypothetical protein [Caudoviricetes sp.]
MQKYSMFFFVVGHPFVPPSFLKMFTFVLKS